MYYIDSTDHKAFMWGLLQDENVFNNFTVEQFKKFQLFFEDIVGTTSLKYKSDGDTTNEKVNEFTKHIIKNCIEYSNKLKTKHAPILKESVYTLKKPNISNDYQKMNDDFQSSINPPKPKEIDFTQPIFNDKASTNDTTSSNMDDLLEKMIRERQTPIENVTKETRKLTITQEPINVDNINEKRVRFQDETIKKDSTEVKQEMKEILGILKADKKEMDYSFILDKIKHIEARIEDIEKQLSKET